MLKWILILMLFLSLLSCSMIRKDIKAIADEDIKNYKASIHIAKEFVKTWPLNSGFIRGSLGDRINQFPVGVVSAMDELDALCAKENLTEFELGYSLGIRIRLLSEIVMAALKVYAPEVLKYIPLTF